jgi:hypothetical protein
MSRKNRTSAGVDVERERMISDMLESLYHPSITNEPDKGWRLLIVEAFRIVDRREKTYHRGRMNYPDSDALHDMRNRLLYHWMETLEEVKDENRGLHFIGRVSRDRCIPNTGNNPRQGDANGGCIVS